MKELPRTAPGDGAKQIPFKSKVFLDEDEKTFIIDFLLIPLPLLPPAFFPVLYPNKYKLVLRVVQMGRRRRAHAM